MLPRVRVSLANKCQLLFGAAVLLLLGAALTVVALRMQTLVEGEAQSRALGMARDLATGRVVPGPAMAVEPGEEGEEGEEGLVSLGEADLAVTIIDAERIEAAAKASRFVRHAVRRLGADADEERYADTTKDERGRAVYRLAYAVRGAAEVSDDAGGAAEGGTFERPLRRLIVVQARNPDAGAQTTINGIFLVAAGLFAGLLAIATFWFITTRIILSPVRILRGYAQRVSEGDLAVRSSISTGDEFEQLSDMFNAMLERLKEKQDQLSGVNKSLDLRLGELSQTNVSLYEANKMKGEFLANVSHELRTPLNSIVGFAEVLQETLADRTGPVDEKRKRYASNIITSAGRLLELINDLLDVAKIEAGRMELRPERVSIADTAEGLVNLMRPLAEKRDIRLVARVQPGMPLVETDPGRLQQVLFNFLSNAVKFTPAGGRVTLSAVSLPAEGNGAKADGEGGGGRVRLSVTDTGPGIAEADQARVFEKFTQLDPSVTREHGGTGLGLTICRELASLLQGRVELESRAGRGATFSLVIPVRLAKGGAALMG